MDTNPSLTTGNNAMSEKLGDLSPHAPNRLIVKLKDGLSRGERRTVQTIKGNLSVANVKTVRLTGAEIWELPTNVSVEKALAQYRNSAVFEYIEPDYIVTAGAVTPTATLPNDPGFNQLWGLHNTGQSGGTADADIDAPEAWDIQTGDPNLVIGVIDTGVDYNHPDLVGNIWTNPGEIAGDGIDNDGNGYVDDIRGWDFAYNDNDPMDVHGHGTHVSGTIAGKGNNGVGVTGVAWNAKIMPLKFLNDSGSGYTSDAILAIDYATAKGVKITNNSWGGFSFSQALYDSINAAGQQGALFIAAAGNTINNNDGKPFYPASYNLANIVSVASTTRTDALSSFSNYGSTSVDLGAPGSGIYSTTPGNSYATYSGTSMASPHVAGAAALVWSQNPTWTAQQVKNALMNTGDFRNSLAGKTFSGRRLNVYSALAGANLPVVTVVATDASAAETALGETPNPGQYTLTRTGSLTSALTVNIAMSGTATNGADYIAIPTTVTFGANSATALVNLNVIDDALPEVTETATLTVFAGSDYTIGSLGNSSSTASKGNGVAEYSATVSIASNELPLDTITLNAADMGWYDSTGRHDPTNTNYFVGDNNYYSAHRNWFTFNLPTLTAPIVSAQLRVKTFRYESLDASETYQLQEVTTAVSTLTAGGSGQRAIYADLGDGVVYGSRVFTSADHYQYVTIDLNGSAINALEAKSGQSFALGGLLTTLDTIDNFEYIFGFSSPIASGDVQLILNTGTTLPVVTVAANDPSAAETALGVTLNQGQYTLTRTGSLTSALTVNIAMSGTALNGSDYTAIPTTVTFEEGSATALVNLNVIDDSLVEVPETAVLTVGAGTGYTVGATASATVTIADDDTTIETGGNTKLLKDGANKYFAQVGNNIPVSVKNGTTHIYEGIYGGWQTLAAETVNGVNQVLWVSPRTNTMHVWVMDSGWTRTSTQNIGSLTSSAAYAQETVFGVDANGDGTIGSPPSVTLAVSPASVTEDGAANLVYTFTRGGATTNALTVNYSIAGTADGSDYTGATPGTGKTITIAASAATATLTLDPTADAVVEANETVALTLATGTGYTIGTTAAVTGTIANDDTAIETVGNTKLLKDGANKYFAQAGSNTPVAIKNGTIHFYPGIYGGWQTLAAETVNGVNQLLWANPGTNTMSVLGMNSSWEVTSTQIIGSLTSSAALAQETVFGVDANGDGTIGSPPSVTLAVSPASVTEDGAANLVYTFTRGGATTNALTVNYSIAGTADAADYTGATPGTGKTITFAAGAATATLTLNPTADAVVEANETVALTLATGAGYTIGTTAAVTGTITNDDTAIETVGNTKLLKDGANKYFAQAGSNTPISIKNGTTHVYEGIYSGWQTLAAETVGGVNQVLWVSPGTNTMHVWVMDSGWTRTSTQNIGSLTSSAAYAQETVFGVDANGDGTIGGLSALTSAEGDTRVVRFGESTVTAPNQISDFVIGADKIDLLTQGGAATGAPAAFTRAADSAATNINTIVANVFADADGATAGSQALGLNSAALVRANTSTYLIVNDGVAGFQSANDLVVNLAGLTGALPALGTIPVGNFFL